jgi:eukaryotic-like serine/threonine-protein kinase
VGITECGTPYLVMEYVEGERLLDYADQHQLDIPHRIALFRQVLSAVQHAHTKLLLHRDLKPSNILVNRAGEVKLLDFGIAKLVSNDGRAAEVTELTRAAGQPLTLMYASPEQLRGEALTTACDVYALGVVLYGLLCGQHPIELKSNSAARAEDAVLHQEPRTPSRRAFSDKALTARSTSEKALRRMLCGDLDAIVLRALAKAPADRFGSVDAFGADIGRWTAGEPVEARAPSAWYYLDKFVARNRVGVGLGAAAVSALLAAGAVALVQGIEASKEAQRAVASRDFLLRMFNDVDPDLAKGRDLTARQLLEQGKARLDVDLRGQPALQAELLMGIGQAQDDLGDPAADATLTKAVNLFARLRDPQNEALALLIRCRVALRLYDVDHAAELLGKAATLVGEDTGNIEVRLRLLEAEGQVALYRKQLSVARSAFEAFVRLAESSQSVRPLELVSVRLALASTASSGGQASEAGLQLERAESLLQSMPDVPAFRQMEFARTRATVQFDLGQYAQMQSWLPQVLGQCDPKLDAQREGCLIMHQQQIRALLRMGHATRAVALLPGLTSLVSPEALPRQQIESVVASIRALAWAGDSDAHEHLAEKLAVWGQPDVANPLPSRLELLADRPRSALQWVARARALADEAKLRDTPEAGRTALFEGVADEALGMHDEALHAMSPLCSAVQSGSSRRVVDHLFSLNCARSMAAAGRRSDAVAHIDQALPLLRSNLGSDAPTVQRAERLRSEMADPTSSNGLPAGRIQLFS